MLLLRQLVELRIAAAYAGVGIEERLDEVIKKMGTVGRMLRHGDGKIANFNGAGMINAAHVEEILNRTGTPSKVLQQAPLSGFMRFASGRTTLILDTGTPASRDTSVDFTVGHGTLSFEMSIGNTQLIVNTGQTAADPNLRHLLCSTSAHSTVSIDDQNSSDPESGRVARFPMLRWGRQLAAFWRRRHMTAMRVHMASYIIANSILPLAAAICGVRTSWNILVHQGRFHVTQFSDFICITASVLQCLVTVRF